MSSAFAFNDRIVWGSNGQIEDILVKMIKFTEESDLLTFAIESYRGFWPGLVVHIEGVIKTDEDKENWRNAMAKSLDHIKYSKTWSDSGVQWINDNRSELIGMVD